MVRANPTDTRSRVRQVPRGLSGMSCSSSPFAMSEKMRRRVRSALTNASSGRSSSAMARSAKYVVRLTGAASRNPRPSEVSDSPAARASALGEMPCSSQ